MRILVSALLLFSSLAAATPPSFRLPTTIRPTRYALELTLDPAKDNFSGAVTIELDVRAPSDIIWLNASGLTLDEARVNDAPARVVAGDDNFGGVEPAKKLPPGPARLTVKFRGTIDKVRSRAIYRQDEGADAYLYTNFEPTDARRAFPCFDEPSFKVPWQVTLRVPKGQRALGNAPVARETPDGEFVRVELAPSQPLPSYLVAFVVGPFELLDGGSAGRAHTAIRFVVPRGRAAETRWARAVTPRIVDELERYFDMPYPYEKLDVAVVPRYWGTMEHPGLVALGQPLTLIRPTEESLQRKQAYANIAIHELGHYWFGDYVTCNFWDDTWLNESLGTWLDGKITDHVEPAWQWEPRHYIQRLVEGLGADALPAVKPLHVPITDATGIESSFDNTITYDKGSSLVRMIEHWMGEDELRRAISGYLSAHANGNASESDFLAVLAKTNARAAEAFRSFADQPGVPIITASKACDKTPHLVVSQRRFFASGQRADASRWAVPVCLAWDGGEKCLLLKTPSAELPIDHCPAWVMPNAGAFGYYRSAWDGASLTALARVLPSRPLAERILLADDVEALVEAGQLPLGDALALQPALLADASLVVFRRGAALMELLHRDELDPRRRAVLDRKLVQLLGPRARTLSFTARDDEDPELPQTRQSLFYWLGRVAGDADIQRQARAAVEGWLRDRASLSADLLGVALSVSAGAGDAAWFERLLAEARRARDRRERDQLLRALGGFRTPQLAERAFSLVRATELDLRETTGILYAQLSDRETRDAAWQRLRKDWDAIVPRMRDDEASWLFERIGESFCDAAHRADIAGFLAARAPRYAGAAYALQKGLDRADQCIAAVARNRTAAEKFLDGK
jgi:aminopeptidase N